MSSLIIASGQSLAASGTRDAFGALSDDLVAEGWPPIVVNWADREPADEVAVFTARYRQQATGNGPYGDVRYWDGSGWGYHGGTRWVRHSPEGTVAPPGSSNHGKRRSGDLASPYNSNTAAHRRAQVLAKRHNITCEGIGFTHPEWWHWTYWGPLGVIGAPNPTTATKSVPEEDDMRAIRQTGVPDSGIIIQPGVPPYSLRDQVFDALCGAYRLVPQELAGWQYETAQREHWVAFETAQQFAKGITDADAQKVADKVRAGLGW